MKFASRQSKMVSDEWNERSVREKPTRVWQCPHCEQQFTTMAALKIHAQRSHDRRDVQEQTSSRSVLRLPCSATTVEAATRTGAVTFPNVPSCGRLLCSAVTVVLTGKMAFAADKEMEEFFGLVVKPETSTGKNTESDAPNWKRRRGAAVCTRINGSGEQRVEQWVERRERQRSFGSYFSKAGGETGRGNSHPHAEHGHGSNSALPHLYNTAFEFHEPTKGQPKIQSVACPTEITVGLGIDRPRS